VNVAASQRINESTNQQISNLAKQQDSRLLRESEGDSLVAAAAVARERAYAPYSRFAVGAAVRARDGAIYAGCNVENASHGLTICAERNALAHAVASGARDFTAIAVVTENGVTPCGACRQVLAEFSLAMIVIVADARGNRRIYTLSELLPDAFGPEQLRGD
jgi:cytidine deaminase